ncbi:MAG: hypothetical protein HY553_12220 [Elusimicrobia bacterium]|nr:hypothetical protein [Elusimicrobiota bacterium]
MAKPKPHAGAATPAAQRSRPAVRVEYPQEGEAVAPPAYTFRVAALPEANSVEVSVDGGDWRPCRESVGLWWFDWADYAPGPHSLVALSRVGTSVCALSETRKFHVA